MNKLLFAFATVVLLSAGCNSSQPVSNSNPYAQCGVTNSQLNEKVAIDNSGQRTLSEALSVLHASCGINTT